MTKSPPTDVPVKLFRSVAAWQKWLAEHVKDKGVWLKLAKVGQGVVSVSYSDALDVALYYGWIDGLINTLDEQYYLRRFTPRKPRSLWSKINIARAEKLMAAGRMQPAGLREVEAAKADGRWGAAYDSARRMTVPDDLRAALAKNPKARAFFEKLDKTNRYSVCWRVQTATNPKTRRARVEKLVAMLARGQKIHP